MDIINLADNIARLRRRRQITQEELADYLGVTKAAVSKWENRQTMPDILLLPRLAGLFEVTIDELVGYEAWLSWEQIRCLYRELCEDFASQPFLEVMERVRSLVRRYYSCYPFLVQVCMLYLNHFMLAQDGEERERMLREADVLCDRVLQNCKDVGVCTEAVSLKAILSLRQGRARETIETLEPILQSRYIQGQSGAVLAQAYCMTGEPEKAKIHVQIQQYMDLLDLVGDAVSLLALYETEPGRTWEIMDRAQKVKGTSGVLSTAEAISLLCNSMALAGSFGNGTITNEDLAAALQGAVIKDEEKDQVAWKEYLENVMKKRGSEWLGLYKACRKLE